MTADDELLRASERANVRQFDTLEGRQTRLESRVDRHEKRLDDHAVLWASMNGQHTFTRAWLAVVTLGEMAQIGAWFVVR
jgi:hypothetical protein